MAGTPTTNYNIPTYADTDAPDLSGAYNDAMGIIDTQLKANADAIESATTGNYTGTNPITVDNGQRTISVGTATPGGDGTASGLGVVRVSGKSSDIGTEAEINGSTVPNAKAVADYVAAHGGTAYTAGEGIDISGNQISVAAAGYVQAPGGTPIRTRIGGVYRCAERAAVDDIATDAGSDSATKVQSAQTVPTVLCMKTYLESKMAAAGAAYTGTAPIVVDNGKHSISVANATISAKGVVQLSQGIGPDHDGKAVTPEVIRAMKDSVELTPVTVDILKNLYYAPATGLVFYKAPSE